MEIETRDGCAVRPVPDPGVRAGFGSGAVVAVARVNRTLLGSNEEGSRVRGRKGHACRAQVFDLTGRRGGEFKVFLGVGEHVGGPGADDTVGRGGDDVVCILGPNESETIDWMGMAACRGAGERGLLGRERRARAGVPEEHLAAISAAEDEGGVERGEVGG